jgi:hypothetical protein
MKIFIFFLSFSIIFFSLFLFLYNLIHRENATVGQFIAQFAEKMHENGSIAKKEGEKEKILYTLLSVSKRVGFSPSTMDHVARVRFVLIYSVDFPSYLLILLVYGVTHWKRRGVVITLQ